MSTYNFGPMRARIEKIVGPTSDWESYDNWVKFRVDRTLTLAMLNALSVELCTDAINFNFGVDGECGYSSWTPGTDAMPGYIQISCWTA